MLRRPHHVVGSGGVVLACLVGLVACGGSSTSPVATRPVPTPGAAQSTEAGADVTEVTASVNNDTVNPACHRVKIALGSRVRLLIASDVDDDVHVHGFEIEEKLEAGRPTAIELTADQPGVFTVETHELELELFQLEVG